MNTMARLQAVDKTTLTPLVRQALRSDSVEVVAWDVHPLYGGVGGGTGISNIHQFVGSGHDNGRTIPWSLVLKILTSTSGEEERTGWAYWKREAEAYRSGILHDLPGDFKAPRCFGSSDYPGEGIWLWLEALSGTSATSWPHSRYALAARHLGTFNGAFLAKRSTFSYMWMGQPTQRWKETERDTEPVLAQLPALLSHPLVGRTFSPAVAMGIIELWKQRQVLLDAYRRLPQTLCHLDAFSRNLFEGCNDDGQACTIAIDWDHIGCGVIGEELGAFVVQSTNFYSIDPSALRDFDEMVFERYLDGLRAVGWHGDSRTVRLGYTSSVALRFGLDVAAILVTLARDETQHPWIEQAFGHPVADVLERFGAGYPYILGVADEALRLAGTAS